MNTRDLEIIGLLEKEYIGSSTALHYNNPFELLIATILSAQSTDIQVNKLTEGLFAKYPTIQKMSELTEVQLAQEIKGCGLYRNKAKNIRAALRIILDRFDGQVPCDRDALMSLPGVGRKTANVVLSNAFGIPALAVDTHVFRVANRLGLATGKTPLQVEEQLLKKFSPDKWGEAHHWLIWHGRKVCKARKPLCNNCSFLALCPSSFDKK